jgi:hypothetical protein
VAGTGERIDEWALGQKFMEIADRMEKDMTELVVSLPEEIREQVKKGLEIIMSGVKGVMSGVSDAVATAGQERRTGQAELLDQVMVLEREVRGVKRVTDDWVGKEGVEKVKKSEKEMEKKVRGATCQLKYLDINYGYATDDKRELVRQTVSMLRADVAPEDRGTYDRVMRRTRIVLLGKKTEVRRIENRNIHTIPVLLEMQNRNDSDDMEAILKKGGYYPTFHWPTEIREFIGGIRQGLSRDGFGEQHFVKIRPEERAGEVLIRADVRPENGGRFQNKGVWKCPPLQREYWEMISDLYTPLNAEQLRK